MYKYIAGLLLVGSVCFSAELQEPYASLKVLPFDGHGWFDSNAVPLQDLLNTQDPKIVIEVGSWLGKSTRFIGQNTSEDTIIYAVDTWLGSVNHTDDPRMPFLFQQFLSNVIHAELCHKIVPIRMRSLEAADALNVTANLIYIDAAHDTESVTADILAWNEHLAIDGLMCGDDWRWDTVKVAVKKCAKELNKKIRSSENFWWYE